MRALALLMLLAASVSVLWSGTEAAEYVRGVTFVLLLAFYVLALWPAYRAPREGG